MSKVWEEEKNENYYKKIENGLSTEVEFSNKEWSR